MSGRWRCGCAGSSSSAAPTRTWWISPGTWPPWAAMTRPPGFARPGRRDAGRDTGRGRLPGRGPPADPPPPSGPGSWLPNESSTPCCRPGTWGQRPGCCTPSTARSRPAPPRTRPTPAGSATCPSATKSWGTWRSRPGTWPPPAPPTRPPGHRGPAGRRQPGQHRLAARRAEGAAENHRSQRLITAAHLPGHVQVGQAGGAVAWPCLTRRVQGRAP